MIKNNGRLAVILGFSLFILLAAMPPPGQAQTKLRVSAEIANIRLKPDIGSAIVLQLPRDTILTTVSRQGDWYLVSLVTEDRRTVSGYVHISLVSAAEPGRTEETTEGTGTPAPKPRPTTLPPLPPPTGSPVSVYSPVARFALSLMGGGDYLLGGDLNEAAQGRADYYGDFKGIKGSPDVSPAHIGYVFGGEFLVPLVDQLSLGLGLEYLKSQKSSIILFQKGIVTNILRCRPEMYAYPLRLFIAYAPLQSFYIKVGLEYYFAGCKYFYRTESGNLWTEWAGTATTQGLGAMAGFGLEWNLSGSLAFVFELTGHYAPLSGFKGTGTKTDRLGADENEAGTLYYFELKSAGGDSFPQVYVRSKVPSEAGVFNAREAEVDFTRLALKAGFKVRF